MDKIQRAWDLARKVHKDQKRFDKTPYITHPEGVVEILKEMGVTDENTIITAILHDTIEDGESWVTDTIFKDFGKEIGYLVKLLSLKPGQSYDNYVVGIQADKRALVIKIADSLHNVTDKPTNNMKMKYRKSLAKSIGVLLKEGK